jgi:hypothetical protein
MVFWGVLMQSRLITWLMAIAFFVGLSWGRDAAAELCSGRCEPEAVGIWAISLVAILLGGLRLICLNEDMPEYHRRMATGWSGKGQATGGEQMLPRGLRDRFQAIQMAGLTRHVRRSAVSRWSRICRWQVGMMTGWSGLLYAGTFLLLFSVMTFSHSGNRKPSPSISMPVVFFTIMSVSMVWGALWRRRTRTLPFEFLLPVDRATYLKQVGLAAALNQCQLWIAFCAIAIPWQWIVAPQSSFLLASLLGYSFLCQVGLFGVGAWLLRLRSPTLAFLGFMVAIQVLMFSTVAMEHGPLASCRHIVFWAAGGFAVCGLLLTWAAYRRWLAADID